MSLFIFIETAEKVPSVFEKWGFRGIFELKSVLISPQERGKLGKENTFSALSFCDLGETNPWHLRRQNMAEPQRHFFFDFSCQICTAPQR